MKTLQEQYNLIKEGKGHKDVFLKDAKSRYPDLVTNSSTFEQTSKILKSKSIIQENYVDLKPITKIDSLSGHKEEWETKFASFLSEAGKKSLNPLVNNEEKINTKEEDEKVKADSKKVAKAVENIESHNYDYSPKVDNINNVNAQEMMNGVYYEVKNDPNLSLEEAQEKAIKNLAKDPLHYVKEGQFGVEGLGYKEQKTEEVSGDHKASGYSDKIKEGESNMVPVKEELKPCTGCGNDSEGIEVLSESVVTTGNPNSLAAMSGEVIRKMMKEEEWQQQSGAQYHKDLYAEENQEDPLPMDEGGHLPSEKEDDKMEEGKKDHDGDGDIDSDDYLAARDKAIKANMKKRSKKESIDSKLAEIGKEGDIVKMEAQLDYLSEYIQEKMDRLNSINEDENLQELIDKKKMKAMQKEIKLLEKRKQKMEKLYEKFTGKQYTKRDVVGEMEEVDESFDSLVKKVDKEKGYDKEDAKRVAGFIANRKRAGAGSGPTAKMKKREG